MYDTHVHTTFSIDSNIKTNELLFRSKAEGLSITITDHFDFTVTPGMLTFDPQKYFEHLAPLRSDKFLVGVEIGLNMACQEKILAFVKNHSFDYILGSIHNVGEEQIYNPNYFCGLTLKEAYHKYLSYLLACLQTFPFINSLAHYDFVSRYAPYPETSMKYSEYADLFDQIFILLAERDAALEINMKCYDAKSVKDYIEVYKRFRELGGKYVTIGSDAHRITDLARNLKTGFELATYCALKPVYFKEQTPNYIDLRNYCASGY